MVTTEPQAGQTEGKDAVRRCGFVALIGAPNVGKSTLLNRLVGSKVSIVTPKVQTTRNRVIGIAIVDDAQIVYVDTPGLFRPRKRLDRAMVDAAWGSARDADETALLVDPTKANLPRESHVLDRIKTGGRQVVAVINKIDLVARPVLLNIADRLNRTGAVERIFMISALNGDGVSDFEAEMAARMPLGPWLYPEDQIADMPMRLFAAEITREQVFLQLQQELPYATAVETETWSEQDDGSVRIDQVIFVERDGQRKIVLGKKGSRIKAIGTAARQELERLMGRRVHLFLHVKVREGWAQARDHFQTIGLNYDV